MSSSDEAAERLRERRDGLDGSSGQRVEPSRDALAEASAKLANSQLDMKIRLAVLSALEPATPLVERLGRALEVILSFDTLGLQKKGGIFRVDPDAGALELLVTRGAFDEAFLESERRVPLGHCLCGRVAVDGELLCSDDCLADVRHRHPAAAMEAHGHCIVPLKSGAEVKGVLFLYTDANPQWRAERIETLREIGLALGAAIHREEALELLTAQRMFVTISHEINNPLQILMGLVDSLLREGAVPSEAAEKVRRIRDAARRIADLVEKCRTLHRVEPTIYDGDTEMLKLTPASSPPRSSRR